VGNAIGVVQAQRHVHSATGSGLAAGPTGTPQALAVEVDPVGVIDQAVEDGVGVGGLADQRVPGRARGVDRGSEGLSKV